MMYTLSVITTICVKQDAEMHFCEKYLFKVTDRLKSCVFVVNYEPEIAN